MHKIWQKWKKISEKIGNFQFNILFSILYFIVFTPLGILSSIFNDFLRIRKSSGWNRIKDNTSTLEKIKNQ